MKIKLKRLIAFICVFMLSTSIFCVAHAEASYDDLDGWEKLRDSCESIDAYKLELQTLNNDYPDCFDSYSFWLVDLDDDGVNELIVATISLEGEERLLVYTYEHDSGVKQLFNTAPPVTARYGFFKTKSGKAMYSAVTGLAAGEVEEGEVTLNSSKNGLIYNRKNSYSMASGGSTKYSDAIDVSGYYSNDKALDWGPLKYKKIVKHDFELGSDNLSFGHNTGYEVSAFDDLNYREVTDAQYKALTQGKSDSHKALIDEYLKTSAGICYGANTIMTMIKNGDVTASKIESDAGTAFDLDKPNEDETYYCTLNYVHAYQYDPDLKKDFSMDIGRFLKFGLKDDLKTFVKTISDKKWQTLNYLERGGGGHSIIITSLDYFQSLGLYRLTLYDLNSVTDSTREGYFGYMFIKDDFSEFVLKDAGELKDEDNLRGMWLQDMEKVSKLTDKSLIIGGGDVDESDKHDNSTDNEKDKKESATDEQADSIATLYYSPDSGDFTLISAEKKTLYVTDGVAGSDDFEIEGFSATISEGINAKGYISIKIPDSNSYTLNANGAVDLKLVTEKSYYTLKADELSTAELTDGGIVTDKTNGSFEAGVLGKSWLVKLYGKAESGFKLTGKDDDLTFSSSAEANVDTVEFYGDNTVKTFSDLGKQTELKLSEDSMERTGFPVILLIAIAALAAILIAVVLLLLSKKKRNAK